MTAAGWALSPRQSCCSRRACSGPFSNRQALSSSAPVGRVPGLPRTGTPFFPHPAKGPSFLAVAAPFRLGRGGAFCRPVPASFSVNGERDQGRFGSAGAGAFQPFNFHGGRSNATEERSGTSPPASTTKWASRCLGRNETKWTRPALSLKKTGESGTPMTATGVDLIC